MFETLSRPKTVVFVRLSALLLLASIFFASPSAAGAQDPVPDPRFGAIDAYASPERAAEGVVGWERITFDWSLIQPNPDVLLDTSSLNEEWFTEARTANREVVGVLVNTPAWATEGRNNIGVPEGLYLLPGSSENVWANFVREVVGAYQRRGVNRWMVWQNPNIPSGVYGPGWEGSMQDYYQMLKVAYIVARQVNPEAQIHLPVYSLSYDSQWFSRLLQIMAEDETAEENDYYFDIASIQTHYETDSVFTNAQLSFFIMQQNEIFKDLWIVESGAYPPNIALADYPEITPDQHASYVIQSFALGLAAGVQRIAVDHFVDTLTDDDELLPGLIGPAGGPRPAYDAYRVVTKHFAGAFEAFHNPIQFELVGYVRLKHADRLTHIAWTRSDQPAFLSVPARGEQALLVDQRGNEQSVQPEDDGRYRVRLEGATCNGAGGGCPIGGPVMVLVETGIDPVNNPGSGAQVQAEAAPTLTADQFTPTPQPTATLIPTIEPTVTRVPDTIDPAVPTEVIVSEGEAAEEPVQAPDEAPPQVTATVQTSIAPPPTGAAAIAPFALVGLGALIIGGGLGFWLRERRQPPMESLYENYEDEEDGTNAE